MSSKPVIVNRKFGEMAHLLSERKDIRTLCGLEMPEGWRHIGYDQVPLCARCSLTVALGAKVDQ